MGSSALVGSSSSRMSGLIASARDAHALLLAARQAGGKGIALVGQAHTLEQSLGLAPRLVLGPP
jgi:hypothetical protein